MTAQATQTFGKESTSDGNAATKALVPIGYCCHSNSSVHRDLNQMTGCLLTIYERILQCQCFAFIFPESPVTTPRSGRDSEEVLGTEAECWTKLPAVCRMLNALKVHTSLCSPGHSACEWRA